MHVLRRHRQAVAPGGVLLDLQAIPPHPRIEAGGRLVCVADGSWLLARARAAAAAVDLLVAEGSLLEEAVDDHDVLKHYGRGAALVDDWEPKPRKLPDAAIPLLRASERECVVRERCRLRRLRRAEPAG